MGGACRKHASGKTNFATKEPKCGFVDSIKIGLCNYTN